MRIKAVIMWALAALSLVFTGGAEALVKKTWCGEFYYTATIKGELHCGGGCVAANCTTSIFWVLTYGTTNPDIVQQCDTPGCPCKNYYVPDYLWETYTQDGKLGRRWGEASHCLYGHMFPTKEIDEFGACSKAE